MGFLKIIAIGLLALYIIACIGLAIFQRKLLYFPPADYYSPAEVRQPQFSEHTITVVDKSFTLLTSWYAPAQPGSPTVIYTHGNATANWGAAQALDFLTNQGYGVLIIGYPGYPGSDGRPTQANLVDAAIIQYDWLIDQSVNPEDIILYGTSIGTGVTAQLFQARGARQIVLEAPFLSTRDEAQRLLKVFPIGLIMTDQYRSDLALKNGTVPLAWFHGDQDRVISIESGAALYNMYSGPKTALRIKGGGHNDLLAKGGREFVLGAIRDYTTP